MLQTPVAVEFVWKQPLLRFNLMSELCRRQVAGTPPWTSQQKQAVALGNLKLQVRVYLFASGSLSVSPSLNAILETALQR